MRYLHGTLNIEAESVAAAHELLAQLMPGQNFDGLRIEPYWKIPAQQQATFRIPLEARPDAETVYTVLRLARQLAPHWWTVLGPESTPLVFECILNNADPQHPLRWAHIQIQSSQ